jgi:predicted RNA binding protein YcfA (HicA-like mRNA interferase family)
LTRRTELLRLAKRRGWAAEPTNGGHVRLTKPGCRAVIVSATPSCHRWHRNVLAEMRRAERAPAHATGARPAAAATTRGADPHAVSRMSP